MSIEQQIARRDVEIEDLTSEDTQKDKYLTFHIAKEDYGIEIKQVTEIIGIQKITEIPSMPTFIKGVINLRGKVIPIMDVRIRFKIESRDYDDRTCIIVVNINKTLVGLVVDTVSEVMDIPLQDIEPAPDIKRNHDDEYIHGLGKVDDKVKILLNVNKLLFENDFKSLKTGTDKLQEAN